MFFVFFNYKVSIFIFFNFLPGCLSDRPKSRHTFFTPPRSASHTPLIVVYDAQRNTVVCVTYFFLAYIISTKNYVFSGLTVKRFLIRQINSATLRHGDIETTIIPTCLYDRVVVLRGGISEWLIRDRDGFCFLPERGRPIYFGICICKQFLSQIIIIIKLVNECKTYIDKYIYSIW